MSQPSLVDARSANLALDALAERLPDEEGAGDEFLRALISALIDKESVVRHAAANALQVINCEWRISEEAQKSIPQLEATLNDHEYWVRDAATKALNRIKNL